MEIRIAGHPLLVEVADTEPARTRGLMYRTTLPEEQGMLFVFDDDDFRRFWMRNVYIPLSIAYVKRDGVISNILDMEPHVERGDYYSKHKVPYAIETTKGWFERRGIQAGDRVEIPGMTPPVEP